MNTSERDEDTLPDLNGDDAEKISSPFGPLSVRKDTMWEARLVLSTLDPSGPWAPRLRSAIRQGNRSVVDALLAAVYKERNALEPRAASEPPPGPVSRPIVKCTVLPPSPAKRAG
jgi:hypothetical protein